MRRNTLWRERELCLWWRSSTVRLQKWLDRRWNKLLRWVFLLKNSISWFGPYLQVGAHYQRCRTRVSPSAGGFQTSREEVCQVSGTYNEVLDPPTDLSPVSVSQGWPHNWLQAKNAHAVVPITRGSADKLVLTPLDPILHSKWLLSFEWKVGGLIISEWVIGDAPIFRIARTLTMRNCSFLCLDVNECEPFKNNCHLDAECINTEGSFSCRCRPGYQGDGVKCLCKWCLCRHFPLHIFGNQLFPKLLS